MTKYNLWAKKEGKVFSPFVDIFEVSGGNQFSTIAKAQDEVEQHLEIRLIWKNPNNTVSYDPVFGYKIHKSINSDSFADYDGVQFIITKIELTPPNLSKELSTVESLQYALDKKDSYFSDIAIKNRIKWLKSDGEKGCPGARTLGCFLNKSNDLLCYRMCSRFSI